VLAALLVATTGRPLSLDRVQLDLSFGHQTTLLSNAHRGCDLERGRLAARDRLLRRREVTRGHSRGVAMASKLRSQRPASTDPYTALQARGHRFDPGWLHSSKQRLPRVGSWPLRPDPSRYCCLSLPRLTLPEREARPARCVSPSVGDCPGARVQTLDLRPDTYVECSIGHGYPRTSTRRDRMTSGGHTAKKKGRPPAGEERTNRETRATRMAAEGRTPPAAGTVERGRQYETIFAEWRGGRDQASIAARHDGLSER
jgi:hypothetical protein